MDIKIKEFKLKFIKEVENIYKHSFPKEERVPFCILLVNIFLNKAELYCLFENNVISGFIYLINYKNMVFILYLAIEQNKRSKGYGSYLLNWCLNEKKEKEFYLNIDEVDEKFDDFNIRKRRLDFYLANGFYLTNYLSVEEKCNFNILASNKVFNVEEYVKLDSIVANCILDSKANIVRMEE